MQQIVVAGLGSALGTGAVSYIDPWGHVSGSDATIANRSVLVPAAGDISKLRVILDAAPGAAKSYTFVLYVNGSPTALTCAISGAVATSAEDTANTVAVNAGDILSLECTPAGTPTARAFRCGYMFTPTAAQTAVAMSGSTNAPSVSATRYNTIGNCEASWDATQTNRASVWNIDATITSLYVQLVTAPGSGKNRTFTIMKNGSAEASSVITIADAATTGNVTGLTIDLAPGDTLSVRTVPTSTPDATAGIYWGIAYTPDVDGQYCWTGVDQNPIANGDRYNSLTQYPISWSTTQPDRDVKAGASSGYVPVCKSIRVLLSAAPSAGDARIFALTVDSTPSALSVTVADAATTGVTTTDVTPTLDQLLGYKHSITGTPDAAFASVALLMQMTAVGGIAGGRTRLPLLGVG